MIARILNGLETGMPPQMMRFAVAPHLCFPVAFIFMAIDYQKYQPYRHLLLIGKMLAIFTAILVLPQLVRLVMAGSWSTGPGSMGIFLAIVIWDAIMALLLLLSKDRTPSVQPSATVPEAETVEVN